MHFQIVELCPSLCFKVSVFFAKLLKLINEFGWFFSPHFTLVEDIVKERNDGTFSNEIMEATPTAV